MGMFDPMVVGNPALTGVLEFNAWPALWLIMIGLLSTGAAAIGLSGLRLGRLTRFPVPKLAHTQLAAIGMSRAK